MERLEMYLNALETGNRDNIPIPKTRLDKRMEAIVDKYMKKIVNALRGAITETGEPYGTNGYKVGVMLDTDNKTEIASEAGMCLTGFIPVTNDDVLRVKNIKFSKSSELGEKGLIYFYNSRFEYKTHYSSTTIFMNQADNYGDVREYTVAQGIQNVSYVRILAHVIDDSTLITVNEEIE